MSVSESASAFLCLELLHVVTPLRAGFAKNLGRKKACVKAPLLSFHPFLGSVTCDSAIPVLGPLLPREKVLTGSKPEDQKSKGRWPEVPREGVDKDAREWDTNRLSCN